MTFGLPLTPDTFIGRVLLNRQIQKHKRKVAQLIFERGIFSYGGTYPTKGQEVGATVEASPYYLSIRTKDHPTKPGLLTPEDVQDMVALMRVVLIAERVQFDHIVGLPFAGEPLAQAIADHTGSRLLRLHKEEVTSSRRIVDLAGSFTRGERALLVDDVITGAHSMCEGFIACTTRGLIVPSVLALADRMEGGVVRLQRLGCTVHVGMTVEYLLRQGVALGYITAKIYDHCMSYARRQYLRAVA
jgi:orotate phosphoribosyltransferase